MMENQDGKRLKKRTVLPFADQETRRAFINAKFNPHNEKCLLFITDEKYDVLLFEKGQHDVSITKINAHVLVGMSKRENGKQFITHIQGI